MPRRKRDPDQANFLENYGKTAPAVPAIRQEVQAWREQNYPGVTATTYTLLNYWFRADHKLPDGNLFRYNVAQREAVESLIYVFEIAKTRSPTDLFQRYIPAELRAKIHPPSLDPFARYAVKMATGSGKTKVMALAIAWQYLNAVVEGDPDCATTFLIIAPNVIVFERLSLDFAGGRIFQQDPIIPKELRLYWEVQTYVRGDAERGSSIGAVYLTNVQQLYDHQSNDDDEPDIMTAVLGSKPPANLTDESGDFRQRILDRADGRLMVLNDEAHHTHDPQSVWNETIRGLHDGHQRGLALQLDLSATPRYASGALFEWVISDYTLKQAIVDRIVKRPIKGITDVAETQSDIASIRYQPFLIAAVERWREYREQLSPMHKKPLLFVMLNSIDEAESVGEYLQTKYRDEFGGDKTLVIHTKLNGDIVQGDLDKARRAAREVDHDESPINAIVSVLMLREGWDVQNVTVIVGLRPYTSKANILPEQTIGRGLRLMFRSIDTPYVERVDVIGNRGFIKFIEELEQNEGVEFQTWEVGKEKLVITVIQPEAERAEYDIGIPSLSPILVRETDIASEVESIDVMKFRIPPLPITEDSQEAKTFRYEGKDIITLEKLVEREYTIPLPQTAGEIISYYSQAIAQELKLPSQFAILAPKVRDFLKYKAFGREVDLEMPEIVKAINRPLTKHITLQEFLKVLRDRINKPQKPTLESAARLLSGIDPFAWSQTTTVCQKTIFNKVPCDNELELQFARFLDNASDVARFSKLPLGFGFSIPYTDTIGNLRHYYPDFVIVDSEGVCYIVETKGREDTDVANKDRAATIWADNATELTGQFWHYVKVLQRDFQKLQTNRFADLAYVGQITLPMLDD